MFQFATLFSIVALLAMSKVASAEDFPGQRVNIEVVGTPDAPTELIVGDNAGVWSLTYLAVIGDPNKPDEKLWQRVIFDGVTREETLEPIGEAKWKVKLSKGIIPEIREVCVFICQMRRANPNFSVHFIVRIKKFNLKSKPMVTVLANQLFSRFHPCTITIILIVVRLMRIRMMMFGLSVPLTLIVRTNGLHHLFHPSGDNEPFFLRSREEV